VSIARPGGQCLPHVAYFGVAWALHVVADFRQETVRKVVGVRSRPQIYGFVTARMGPIGFVLSTDGLQCGAYRGFSDSFGTRPCQLGCIADGISQAFHERPRDFYRVSIRRRPAKVPCAHSSVRTSASASAKVGRVLWYQATCRKAPAASCDIRPCANNVTSENSPNKSAGVVRRIASPCHHGSITSRTVYYLTHLTQNRPDSVS
jgi:hypothetical protein